MICLGCEADYTEAPVQVDPELLEGFCPECQWCVIDMMHDPDQEGVRRMFREICGPLLAKFGGSGNA